MKGLLYRSRSNEIYYKTDQEIELIRQSCLLVCKVLAFVAEHIRPGITGLKLDREAEELIREHRAIPAFKGYNDYPATLCISVNQVVVHGIPGSTTFKEGDVVSVDCGVLMNDFYGDAAYTFPIGEVDSQTMNLLRATKTALYKGIQEAIPGKRIGDISYAIQNYVEKTHGYSVVRELVGHGLGKSLHEDPEVPNFGKRGNGPILKEGLVIAIEPMINMGKKDVLQSIDGWTIFTKDGKPSAHFEHTVAIRKGQADILSDHAIVENAIAKNPNIQKVEIFEEHLN